MKIGFVLQKCVFESAVDEVCLAKWICNIYNHAVRMDQMLFYDVSRHPMLWRKSLPYGENRSDRRNLWRKLLLLDGDKNRCLLRATSNIFGTTVLRNQARRSGRRVFSSATYSCIQIG